MNRLRIGKVRTPASHLHGHLRKRSFWKTFRQIEKALLHEDE